MWRNGGNLSRFVCRMEGWVRRDMLQSLLVGRLFFVRVTHEQTPRKIAACFTFVYLIFIRIYKKEGNPLKKPSHNVNWFRSVLWRLFKFLTHKINFVFVWEKMICLAKLLAMICQLIFLRKEIGSEFVFQLTLSIFRQFRK